MELSKQDQAVIAVIKSMQEMGLIVINTATELGTGSIHIKGRRNDGVEIIAVVNTDGRTYYETWD